MIKYLIKIITSIIYKEYIQLNMKKINSQPGVEKERGGEGEGRRRNDSSRIKVKRGNQI